MFTSNGFQRIFHILRKLHTVTIVRFVHQANIQTPESMSTNASIALREQRQINQGCPFAHLVQLEVSTQTQVQLLARLALGERLRPWKIVKFVPIVPLASTPQH
jgi:hypothetical protein